MPDNVTALLAMSGGGSVDPEKIAEVTSEWLEENLATPSTPPIDSSLTVANAAADAKATGDKVSELKSALNNAFIGSDYEWTIGTLNPGRGTESTSNARIRSEFIDATVGTKLTLVAPNSRLLIYCFDANKAWVSDSTWLGYNTFTVTAENVAFVRVLIRKDTSNSSISASEVSDLASGLTIEQPIPKTVYSDMPLVGVLYNSLDGSRYLPVENGTITVGKPQNDTKYVRSPEFVFANAGDTLTVAPVGFGVYNSALYLYTTNDSSGYKTSVSIPPTASGGTWTYVFKENCWFKFRASDKASDANITPADIYKFNYTFHIDHVYDADEILGTIQPLSVDYDTLNAEISGKFNLAIQTDTHMSKFVAYTSNQYLPSDFDSLRAVVGSVNKLSVNLFANLGDLVRGYQCDPDFETRESADLIIDCYKKIKTNKAFVIGNHDDGCLYYSDAVYNDKKNVSEVMFPSEQFNRYTKYGVNNNGIKNYYYSDINGVRVITLYQRDFDYSQSVPGIESFKIGSAQLSWLVNTALNTSLPVIVLTHAPLAQSLYSTSRDGFDDVLSALNTFVANGGTVIAVLSGHTHAQNNTTVDGINHIVFKNGYDFFTLVSVDLTARTIKFNVVNSSLSPIPDLSY